MDVLSEQNALKLTPVGFPLRAIASFTNEALIRSNSASVWAGATTRSGTRSSGGPGSSTILASSLESATGVLIFALLLAFPFPLAFAPFGASTRARLGCDAFLVSRGQ